MRRIVKNAVIALLMLMVCSGLASTVALAAETLKVAIPVSVAHEGAVPDEIDGYVIKLKADDASYPMPEGSEEGIYTLKLKGAEETAFPEITYEKLGVYTYTVWQEAGSNSLCSYDSSVFKVTVYIVNSENGGYASTVVVRYEGETDKEDTLIFKNVYTEPPKSDNPPAEVVDEPEPPVVPGTDITVVKVWNDDGTNRPASVFVQLLNGEMVQDTITLDTSNNWTYKWVNLAADGQWKVQEINIPNGYTPSYTLLDGIVTITNTRTLVKTGQLNWPIPVLATIGIIILSAGLMMLLRERKDKYAS